MLQKQVFYYKFFKRKNKFVIKLKQFSCIFQLRDEKYFIIFLTSFV